MITVEMTTTVYRTVYGTVRHPGPFAIALCFIATQMVQ